MSLKASKMQSAVVSANALEAIVREQIQMIDGKIQNSHRVFGRNVIVVDLATIYSVPGLDKQDQQRFIYSEIIKSLRGRDFEAGLVLDKGFTQLYVAFVVQFDPEQIAAMNAIIKSAILATPESIDVFLGKNDPSEAEPAAAEPSGSPPA